MRPQDPPAAGTPPAAPGAHAGPPVPESAGAFGAAGPAAPAGPVGDPGRPEVPTRLSKAGSTGAIVAAGTGLLGAAVIIAALRSRDTDDGNLDWSNYGVGLGATAVLLLVALLGAVAARRRTGGRAREEVVTWPGAVGILATAVMLNVGIDSNDDWLGYLTGATLVVLGALGYVVARRAAFVVVAIAGLAIVYVLAYDDFVADSIADGHPQVVMAVLVALFVVVVTLLGWALPSRAVTGVVVGAVGVAAYVAILASFVVTRVLGSFFGGMPMLGGQGAMDQDTAFGGPMGPMGPVGFEVGFDEADVWWVLAFAAILTVLWALGAAVSNHSGFSLLAIAMPALTVPLASVALAVEHPTRWSGAVAAAGAVLLLGGVALARLRGKSAAREV